MIKRISKKRATMGVAALSIAASMFVGSAGADPQQFDGIVGVGSDTTQDVFNAFAGYSNGFDYTPLQTNASTNAAVRGDRQINSFDAIKPGYITSNCIVSKLNGPAFWRPNGSGAGRRALAASNGQAPVGGTLGWTGPAGVGCGTLVDITGQVDFARSSGLGGSAGNDVTFVPMAQDGVSFAYYKPAGAGSLPAVTEFSYSELNQIFTSSTRLVKAGVTIIPCGIQTSSGTHTFWRNAVGADATTEDAATNLCNLAGTPDLGRMQENEGPALIARGDALVGDPGVGSTEFQVISGFSAAAYISKAAGLATPAPGAVQLGTITSDAATGGGVPGNPLTAGAPNPTFYNNAVFGRTVYNVLPFAVANAAGNTPLKQLFIDTDPGAANTSRICQASSTINAYGFLAIPNCGALGTNRAWERGNA